MSASAPSHPAGFKVMSPKDAFRLPQPAPTHCVPYGPLKDQTADLYLPDNKAEDSENGPMQSPVPLLVMLHGGCWMAAADRKHVSFFCQSMAARGVAVWNVEYRRVGQEGGGWPGTFEDVAQAWSYLPGLKAFPVDLRRVVLVGHSAGGQLALWLASQAGGEKGNASEASEPAQEVVSLSASELDRRWIRPLAVVALAPVFDLEQALSAGACREVVPGLLNVEPEGEDEAGPHSYAARLQARLAQTSPAHMQAPAWPVYALWAAHDKVVPDEQRLAALQVPGIVHEPAVDTGHFELITPGARGFEAFLATLDRVLAQCP